MQIRYGDYIYLSFQREGGKKNLVSCDGHFSVHAWSGPFNSMFKKNYLHCLFQLHPNQHSAKDWFTVEAERQFKVLQTLDPSNQAGKMAILPEINAEKEKEKKRLERVNLLNTKEQEEQFGKPIRVNGKFTLKHVQSGMFLEVVPKSHSLSNELTEVVLTSTPWTDNHFELHTLTKGNETSEFIEYGTPVKIFVPKFKLYLVDDGKQYIAKDTPQSINPENKFLNTKVFAKHPLRRQEAQCENQSLYVVGSQFETSNSIVFDSYDRKTTPFLKTGEYLRLFSFKYYFTVHWYANINKNLNKMYGQAYESLEYKFNQSNTIFSFSPILTQEDQLPQQEVIVPLDIENLRKKDYSLKNSPEAKKYLLRHQVSGCFLAIDPDKNLVLVSGDDLTPESKYWWEVVIFAKPLEDKSHNLFLNYDFVIAFTKGGEISLLNFSEEPYPTSNVQLEVNTTYFMGFFLPDDYVNKKLRPDRKKLMISSTYDENKQVKFRAELVKPHEINAFLRAESLSNSLGFFLDFMEDLKTPWGRDEHKKYQKNITDGETEEKEVEKDIDEISESEEPTPDGVVSKPVKKTVKVKVPLTTVWDKIEKDTLLYLNKKMRELADIIRLYMYKEPIPKPSLGDETAMNLEDDDFRNILQMDEIENPDGAKSNQLTQLEIWMAREFRVIDQMYIILHYLLRDSQITNQIKNLNKKFEDQLDFVKLDHGDCMYFFNSMLELLLTLLKKDSINHLYGSQYTRVCIHCLTVEKEGLLQFMKLEEKYEFRELLLQLTCNALWDDDLDALGQLNFFIENVKNAIMAETDYQGLYIRLLNHQSRSKAPNLDNKVETQFITQYLPTKEIREHMFPMLEEKDGELLIKFIRYPNRESGATDYKLKDLIEASKIKIHKDTDPEMRTKRTFAEYFLNSLKLLHAMAQSDHLLLYQVFVKHYPYTIVTKFADASSSFFELRVLLGELITNIHMRYCNVPIKTFPPQIRIVGESAFNNTLVEAAKKTITSSLDTLISDIEQEVIREKEMVNEIESCKKLTKDQLSQTVVNKLMSVDNSHEDEVAFLEIIKYGLSSSAGGAVPLSELKEMHILFCKVLMKTRDSKDTTPQQVILEALNILNQLEDQVDKYAALEIVEQISKKSKIHFMDNTGDLGSSLGIVDEKEGLISTKKVAPLPLQDAPEASFEISIDSLNKVIDDTIEGWKSKEKLFSNQANEMLAGPEQYNTSALVKLLFQLMLKKDPDITLEVLKRIKRIASFENNLLSELKQLSMITDKEDVRRTTEVINIIFKMNEYIRLFKCKQYFSKAIPTERVAEIFKDIDSKINQLLFTIYNVKKHFRYSDPDQSPEDRFLKGYERWKSARWDKPMKVVGEAVSRVYQRIYLALNIPMMLFEIIEIAISIKEDRYTEAEKLYLNVIRKTVFILLVFVYKNRQSQDYLYAKKKMILNYYRQVFINQTVDVMPLFSEMMRDNQRLQKLPIKYLYDITWYTFFGTLGRRISGVETNSYLCVTLGSLHYLHKLRIGKDVPQMLKEKIEQMLTVLSSHHLDTFDLLSKWISLRQGDQATTEAKLQSIEASYSYLSIREFMCSWLEILPKILKDGEFNTIMSDLNFSKWEGVLSAPPVQFQFELRNLYCKFVSQTWYSSKQKLQIAQDPENFKKLIFQLFADLNAYILWVVKHTEVKELEDYNPKYYWLAKKEDVAAHNELYEKFDAEKLYNAKLFIYVEDIPLLNLWKEYIYEGLLELLNKLLLHESDRMVYTYDYQNRAFQNPLLFYLHFIEKLCWIPCDLKENPFLKLDDALQKASLLPEYKAYKPLIIKLANHVRETRPILKNRAKLTTRTRRENGNELFEKRIDALLKNKAMIREKNTRAIAESLGTIKEYKKIIAQIISNLRANYLRMNKSEVVFTLELLRKIIEKENTREEEERKNDKHRDDTPIYMWDSVKLTDLKKIYSLQILFKENRLTDLIFTLKTQLETPKITKEILKLGLAYLYGGNSIVQKEFFEKFSKEEENIFLESLNEIIENNTKLLREFETERISKLYSQSLRETFENSWETNSSPLDDNLLFERVRDNMETADFVDATKHPEHGDDINILLLALSFLQGLVEKQCADLQNFLRDQTNRIKSDDSVSRYGRQLNFLGKLRSLFNTYYKIHSKYNITIGFKIVDVLAEFVQGNVKANILDILKKTFLNDLCKMLTEYNNRLHLLPRGFDPDPYTGEFMALKRKIIGVIKNIAEYSDRQDSSIIENLKKYLDLAGLLNVFEGCMYKFFGWSDTNHPTKNLMSAIEAKMQKYENSDLYGCLGDALNIYIIFRYIWDNNQTFEEEMKKLIKENRNQAKGAVLQHLILTFCLQQVHSVEILQKTKSDEDVIIKYWFPLYPACGYLNESTKIQFLAEVDRTNTNSKIRELIDASDFIIPQMEAGLEARNLYFGLNAENIYQTLRLFTNFLALLINLINLFTLIYEGEVKRSADGIDSAVLALNIVHTIFAGSIVILWLVTYTKRHLSATWEQYTDEYKKETQILPQAIEQKFQDEEYESITKDECLCLLKFKGPNSEEFDIIAKHPVLYEKIRAFYHAQNFWFLITSGTLMWHVAYTLLSVGSIFTPIVTTLLSSDIASQSRAIMAVLKAVYTNWRQFLWTLFLLIFVATFYTFIGFYLYQDTFSVGEDESEKISLCTDTFGCFLTVLNLGLRNGGGIGDAIQPSYYSRDDVWPFIARVVFDISFFIIMITILLNLIFGMIIDAFGDLRDQRVSDDDDQQNTCFICGITRTVFERFMNFEDHTTREHNVWDYLFFIVYCKEKYKHNKNDMNEVENYVIEKYYSKMYDWFPVSRSLTLETKQQEKNEDIITLQRSIKALTEEFKDFKKEMLGARHTRRNKMNPDNTIPNQGNVQKALPDPQHQEQKPETQPETKAEEPVNQKKETTQE